MAHPVRLGLVGLNFGMTVCRQLGTTPGLPVRLDKVCDLNEQRAQAISHELGVGFTLDLDELLDDPNLDAIGIYTSPVGRADLIRRVLKAGKHVMTTKPFERDPDQALAVLREAAALGKVVHLNSPNARPYGEMAYVHEWVNGGLIGRPTIAQASSWVYYGNTPPDGTWYDDPLRCPVAPLFRLGIYSINQFLRVFKDPVSVQVTHSRIETGRPTPDNAAMTIAFRDGAIAVVTASFVAGCGPDRYRGGTNIAGTLGTIYINPGPAPRDGEHHPTLFLSNEEGIEAHTLTRFSGDYDWEFFAQRIRGEAEQDFITPEDIVEGIRVVNAMSEAEQTGQTAYIKPVK